MTAHPAPWAGNVNELKKPRGATGSGVDAAQLL